MYMSTYYNVSDKYMHVSKTQIMFSTCMKEWKMGA